MKTQQSRCRTINVNRRDLVKLAGFSGGGLVLASSGASMSARAVVSAQDTVTLTFWTPGGSPVFCETQNEIAMDYDAAKPDVALDEVQCGIGSGDDYSQVLLASIAAGNPPDITILWDTPVSYGARGALLALDDLMLNSTYAKAENWPAELLASCRFEGQIFGLPVTTGMYGIWYNQELFESKGIPSDRASFPKTWDELRRLSKEFTTWDGDTLVTAGFMPWHDSVRLAIWSALNGAQLYDAVTQTYTINAEPNIAMMEYSVAWLDEEYKGDLTKVNASGSWGVSPGGSGPPAFQQGRLAMLEEGSWVIGDFYADIEPAFERWDVAPYPVGPGGTEAVTGYYPNWIAIPQGTEHADQAFAYIDYMSGEGVVKWFDAIVDMPTNNQVPELVPQPLVERRGEAFATEIMAFFRQQAQVATPMWDSPIQAFVNDQLSLALERIMAKAATPTDALTEVQNTAQQELDIFLSGQS